MTDLDVVPVLSLHVLCSLKVRCLDQPGYAMSDACRYPADCAVEMPSGAMLYRCPQHWNTRWLEADRNTAQLYPGESRLGPSHAVVPRKP